MPPDPGRTPFIAFSSFFLDAFPPPPVVVGEAAAIGSCGFSLEAPQPIVIYMMGGTGIRILSEWESMTAPRMIRACAADVTLFRAQSKPNAANAITGGRPCDDHCHLRWKLLSRISLSRCSIRASALCTEIGFHPVDGPASRSSQCSSLTATSIARERTPSSIPRRTDNKLQHAQLTYRPLRSSGREHAEADGRF